MSFLFKKKRSAVIGAAGEDEYEGPTEELLTLHDELARVARAARDLLEPFGTREYKSWDQPELNAAGGLEGAGVFYVIAHMDIFEKKFDTDEGVEKTRAARIREVEILIDNQMSWVGTAAVVCTVDLSICVALLVHILQVFDSSSQILGGNGDGIGTGFYAGWQNNHDLLHALHWVECIFLTTSLIASILSIFWCFNIYDGLSTICVDLAMKLDMLVNFHNSLTDIYNYTIMATGALLLAVPFTTGRVSPVASLCTGVGIIGVIVFLGKQFTPGVEWLGRNLHRKIRKLFVNKS